MLDLACGGGDVAIRFAARARQRKIPLTIHGCDFSETALKIANERCERSGLTDSKFFRLDLARESVPVGYDVLMCSLFIHHLDYEDSLKLVKGTAAAAQRAILIDDLLRTSFGDVLCRVGCQILSRSRIVHVDGLRSLQVGGGAHRASLAGAVPSQLGATLNFGVHEF